jgi:hypothetical protein
MSVVGIPRESLPEQTYGQSFVNMFPGWGGAYATPEQKEKASATVASLIDFLIPTATKDMPTEDIRNLYAGQTMGLGFPMATMFPKRYTYQGTDLTNPMRWALSDVVALPKKGMGSKVYHGTPKTVIKGDLKPGIHVGSPGAAIDRLAKKVPWSEDPSKLMGIVQGMRVLPKNPLTKQSPHFRDITEELLEFGYNYKDVENIWKGMGTDLGDTFISGESRLLSEFSDIERTLLAKMGDPKNVSWIAKKGYDVIPYVNFYEHPGSVSLNVLNPKKAGLRLLDETYTVPTPFEASSLGFLKRKGFRPINEIGYIQDLIQATK